MHKSFTGVAGKSRAQALKVHSHLRVSVPSLIWVNESRIKTMACVVSSCSLQLLLKLLSTVLFKKSCPAYLLNNWKVRHLKLESAFKGVGSSNYKLGGGVFFPFQQKKVGTD